MQRGLQAIPRFVLAFIASIALTALCLLICIKFTIFSQGYMNHQIAKSDYAQLTTDDINEYIQDNARGSNISPDIMKNIVSEELVSENLTTFTKAIYTDVPFQLKGEDTIRQKMQQTIENYAKEKNIPLDDEVQKNVTTLIDENVKIFKSYVEIPTFRHYAKQVMLYNKQLILLIVVTAVASLALLFGLWLISGRYIHQKLRFFGYTFSGAALMLLVLPLIVYFSGVVERIAVHSKALYQLLTNYLNHGILAVIYAGIIMLVIAIASIVMSSVSRKRLIG